MIKNDVLLSKGYDMLKVNICVAKFMSRNYEPRPMKKCPENNATVLVYK